MSNKIHSVSSAAAQPDDTILDLVGRLDSVKAKTDKNQKTFYNLKLSGFDAAEAVLYGNVWVKWSPEPMIGQTVIVRGAKMGTFNGNRSFSMQRGSVEEFREDLEGQPQQTPQNQAPSQGHISHAPAHQPAPKAIGDARLSEYAALYAACIGSARQTASAASFDDAPETIRNIASCFFIQAIRDGVEVEGKSEGVPF